MNYIKIFEPLSVKPDLDTMLIPAEEILNDYFNEVEEKGHRVIHTKYHFTDTGYMRAVITVTDTPLFKKGPGSVIKQL